REMSSAAATESSQGVRQLWPDAVLASAPGGSDSIRNACGAGDDLKKFMSGSEKESGSDTEHAAKLTPHATTAIIRIMIRSPNPERRAPPVNSENPMDLGCVCMEPRVPPMDDALIVIEDIGAD